MTNGYWFCPHCRCGVNSHIYDRGALICPPDDEPTDKDDDE